MHVKVVNLLKKKETVITVKIKKVYDDVILFYRNMVQRMKMFHEAKTA